MYGIVATINVLFYKLDMFDSVTIHSKAGQLIPN